MSRAIIVLALALTACAGQDRGVSAPSPAAMKLEGGPWVAEDVNGGGVPDGGRVELTFAGGRVTGRSGCNRVSGGFSQAGATVTFGPLAGTRMACPPALMDLETKVLAVLTGTLAVSFDATGAATLIAYDGQKIRLRRETR